MKRNSISLSAVTRNGSLGARRNATELQGCQQLYNPGERNLQMIIKKAAEPNIRVILGMTNRTTDIHPTIALRITGLILLQVQFRGIQEKLSTKYNLTGSSHAGSRNIDVSRLFDDDESEEDESPSSSFGWVIFTALFGSTWPVLSYFDPVASVSEAPFSLVPSVLPLVGWASGESP